MQRPQQESHPSTLHSVRRIPCQRRDSNLQPPDRQVILRDLADLRYITFPEYSGGPKCSHYSKRIVCDYTTLSFILVSSWTLLVAFLLFVTQALSGLKLKGHINEVRH